jgi:hypothetical protein
MKAPYRPLIPCLLERLVSGPHGEALAGDLIEQYENGRSSGWFWRQAVLAILISGARDRTSGTRAIFPCLVLLILVIATAVRHPASVTGAGRLLLVEDVALLVGYAAFAGWVRQQRGLKTRSALEAGGQAALVIAAIFIANHIVWSFIPLSSRAAYFASGAGVTLIMLGLFGAAGSAAWSQTRSVFWGAVAGTWCASAAILYALSFAFSLNYFLGPKAIPRLRDAFLASGLTDAGAFVAQNGLRAASEDLIRMPLTAAFVGLAGALANAWLTTRPRRVLLVLAWFSTLIFVLGALVLWYSGSLGRADRPPFIVAGTAAASIALCGAHPICSRLLRHGREIPRPRGDIRE